MADNRKSYNAIIRGLKRSFGLTHPQAQVAWRGLKDRLDRRPRAVDLKKHPRISKEEAKRAPARERALRAAKTRAVNKAKKTIPVKAPPGPPKPKGRAAGAGAGAGAGGGGAVIAPPREYPSEYPPEYEELYEEGYEFDQYDEETDY
jgi:hypothetical protein